MCLHLYTKVLNMEYNRVYTVVDMVSQHTTQIRRVGSRHTLYIQKALVEDSAFPFKVGEPLIIRIDSEKLVIEGVST